METRARVGPDLVEHHLDLADRLMTCSATCHLRKKVKWVYHIPREGRGQTPISVTRI